MKTGANSQLDSSFIFQKDILKDKVAFVTGGATGIGLGICQRLAMAGANIVIASRTAEKCEKVAAELSEKYTVKAMGLGLDVRDSAQVSKVMAKAVKEMGSLDILVNNAAGNFYFPAQKLRDKLWKAVLEIDLDGTFYCSRTAFKYMKENGGVILSTTATLQKNGWVGMAHASSAKAGIDALTKTLALEWAQYGIRVNAIAPGPIVTPGVAEAFSAGGQFSDYQKFIPIGRTGEPHEVGDLAVFICSPAATWMTGSIIVLDGGESLSAYRPGIDPRELDDLVKKRKKD